MSPNPSALLPRVGNMYAPPWMCWSPQLPNFRDDYWDIDLPPVTIAPGVTTPPQPLAFDGDADYMVREMWFVVLPSSGMPVNPQDLRTRIRDGDGRLVTSDFVYANDLCGPLVPVWAVRRGSVAQIEYSNQGASSITVQLVIRGAKRFPCQNVDQPVIPGYKPMRYRYPPPAAGFRHYDFEYPFEFDNTSAANNVQLKTPLQTDNDADFLWRGLAGQWFTPNNTAFPTSGRLAVNIYGPDGLALNELGIATPWAPQQYGLVPELLFSNGGGRIAPQFPEIRIPAGGILQADLSFFPGFTPTVLRFSLRGVKVYGAGAC
jgi:hypothetical protein